MSETDGEPRSARDVILARLAETRWVLLASAAAIAGLGLGGSVAPLWQALAFGGIVAVAGLLPRRTAGRRKNDAKAAAVLGLDGHPAKDLAEAVPDPLIVFDEHGMITNANAAARAAFGKLDAGTLLTLRFRTPELQGLVGQLLAGPKEPLSCDYVERVPMERWFRVSGAQLGRDSGLYVLVFKDQSEMRRIDRMRSDFIANASHELRTPLASIAGFVETLRGPARNDAKARDQFLQIMQTQTGRMARLIDDLLSLSRLEMKSFSAPAEPLDLKALIDGVVDALRHLAAENGVEIERDYPDGPVELRGMRDELIQVFENLLENAIKYGQDGKRVVVTVEKPQGASGPRVTVRDFGPGIPDEHIPRLTERFYRVDVDTSRTQKGTGLGLAIVKHILTRHDARLTIRSTLGEGASFTVQFPGK
ncbi:two-component sensor histidine kinase [Aquibium carbonis]|uniref:histidine kinase n=1 Tax=Aquibium carbonis TaxID=2495581 RepID=A0A429YZK0_9HYPH|nr:ATP-binding protein [Aquibium carbonis]RST86895.1 two-component sensor histidine kinase [Aquibium carbonis]